MRCAGAGGQPGGREAAYTQQDHSQSRGSSSAELAACPCVLACTQEVRSAVLELVGNLVVVNSAFTHTCLQLLVYSFLPPPSPPQPDAGQGEWQPSEEELTIQASVLNALNKVRGWLWTSSFVC